MNSRATLTRNREMKTANELVAEARQRITEVSPQDVQRMQQANEDVVILDVRDRNEWNLGHIPGALHISRGTLESNVEKAVPREKRVVAYCASGNRSALAADTMREMGYRDVSSMKGGWKAWVDAGGDVDG